MHDKLVTKANAIDTSVFDLATQYNTNKYSLQKEIGDPGNKIPDTSGITKEKDYIGKITDIEGKIPNITSCATTVALNAVKNKMIW